MGRHLRIIVCGCNGAFTIDGECTAKRGRSGSDNKFGVRGTVRDGCCREGALPDRYRRVGEPVLENLPFRRLAGVWAHQSRNLYVRERDERGRVPGGEKRKASLVCRIRKIGPSQELHAIAVLDLTAPGGH
jgi:hypothetical protein